MNIETALNKLFSLHQFGVKLGLESVTKLLDHIGNPHHRLRTIHIAGSNGKGSTACFLASILTASGMKVGLYTSPHFVRFNERIRIRDSEIPDEYVAGFVSDLADYIEKNKPTFFELTTAMAFKYFSDNQIDIGVIETGLGGRLDATNVLKPEASVITTISKEHTNILGSDIEKIAYEKGGIIKHDSKVFIGLLPLEAEKTIESISKSHGSKLFKLREFISIDNHNLTISRNNFRFNIYRTPLKGRHQLSNCALALLSLIEVMKISDWKIFYNGIENVISSTGITGRYEVVNTNPRIILDSAHNPEGMEAFLREFQEEEKNYMQRSVIFGCMRDKDIELMLKKLRGHFDKIFVTSFQYERAATIEELQIAAKNISLPVIPLPDPYDLINEFRTLEYENCLVILGSIFLLGNVKTRI